MEYREPPRKPRERLDTIRFQGDPRLRAWLRKAGFSELAADDPTAAGFSEDELSYILRAIEAESGARVGKHVHEVASQLTPGLSHPDWECDADLAHVYALPAMQEFWRRWEGERSIGARGPKPNEAPVKALLSVLGMTGQSAHASKAHDNLESKEVLRAIFGGLEAVTGGSDEARLLEVPGYKGLMRRVESLTRREQMHPLVLNTKAKLFQEICEYVPGAGERLLIDGHMHPGWVEQTGKGEGAEEGRRRRTCPDAGARLIEYSSKGKNSIPGDKLVAAGGVGSNVRFVRGYYYVVILDQATGWPLVSQVMDASVNEHFALATLLRDLYTYYPFLQPKCIAGDAAFDTEAIHRMCLLHYGIAPIFRPRRDVEAEDTEPKDVKPGASQRDSIKAIDPRDGRLICMAHNKPLDYDGFEWASRQGLEPGEAAPSWLEGAAYGAEVARREGEFRTRWLDHHGPGEAKRLSFQSKNAWGLLGPYPHHSHGRPQDHAFRNGMTLRVRNQSEMQFSRTQVGFNLSTSSASRTRFQDIQTVESLHWLSELRICSASLAAEQAVRGESGPMLPGTERLVSPIHLPSGVSVASRRAGKGSTSAKPVRRPQAPRTPTGTPVPVGTGAVAAPDLPDKAVDEAPVAREVTDAGVDATPGADDAVGDGVVIRVDFTRGRRLP